MTHQFFYLCMIDLFLTRVVYKPLGYMDVVSEEAETSMTIAINEMKELDGYSKKGEVGNVT